MNIPARDLSQLIAAPATRVASIAVGVVLVGVLGVLPYVTAQQRVAAEAEEQLQLSARLDEVRGRVPALRDQLARLAEAQADAGAAPPVLDEFNDSVTRALDDADSSGVRTDRVTIGQPKDEDGSVRAEITVGATATADALDRYLDLVALDHPFIGIDRLEISPSGANAESQDLLTLQFVLVWSGVPGRNDTADAEGSSR